MRTVASRLIPLVCVVALILAPAAQAASDVPASFADLVQKLMPSVVNISTTQKVKGPNVQLKGLAPGQNLEQFRDFFEQFGIPFEEGEREVTALGSGFILDPSGIIVTNNHVIAEAEEITVTLSDNTKLKATVKGRDRETDLAVLQVDSKKPLPAVTFGNSDAMRVGDWVVAIGNPFGLGGSVSAGIVSARARSIGGGRFDDFIQTDAAINRGNSGGPLFNLKGEVIGINSAIFSPTGGNIGIGFAVPSALAQPVLKQLRESGRTHRGWLGVKIQQVNEEIADSLGLGSVRGALVLGVNKGSPAEKAGIQEGDVILKFDGKDVTEMRQLPRTVAESKVGSKLDAVLWRKGKEVTTNVTLTEMTEKEEEQVLGKDESDNSVGPKDKDVKTESILDMEVAAITPDVREQYGLEESAKGLIVLGVKAGSQAAKQGLQEADVISQVNQSDVNSVDALREALRKAKKDGRKYALLRVHRGEDVVFVTLPADVK